MKERLEEIRKCGIEKIENVKTTEELEEVRRDLLGKKSELSEVLKTLGSLEAEMRKEIGSESTQIKNTFASLLTKKEEELIASKSVLNEPLDLTLPGKKVRA